MSSIFADILDHRMRDPAFLFLTDPEERDHRAGLAARRIFRDFLFCARAGFRGVNAKLGG